MSVRVANMKMRSYEIELFKVLHETNSNKEAVTTRHTEVAGHVIPCLPEQLVQLFCPRQANIKILILRREITSANRNMQTAIIIILY